MSASQIPLIVRSFRRNKLMASILVLQVAITTAAVTNIVFLLAQRIQTLAYVTGLTEAGLAIIETEFVGDAETHIQASVRADMEALRRVPGVKELAAADSLPLGQNNWTVGITNKVLDRNDPNGIVEVEPTIYGVSPGAMRVLGLDLVSGRDFSREAFVPMAANDDYSGLYEAGETIVSEAVAKKLFPEKDPLGKAIFVDGQHPLHIVGMVKHLARPLLHSGADNDFGILVPLVPDGHKVIYLLRTADQDAPRVLEDGKAALLASSMNRLLPRAMSYTELRSDYFRRDTTMALLFLSSVASLLLVTGIGIYGISSFWVRQRYTQIGIRRALGARSRDILVYFLSENFILTGAGAVLGATMAIWINNQISRAYEIPRLELGYLAIGAVVVCLLGQVAAWIPARRAATNAPVVTLRGEIGGFPVLGEVLISREHGRASGKSRAQ